MLHFKELILENFGPYQGTKSIDFTDRDGVIIVWGNNGLGKTTLLNAFKYALFGKVVNRENIETSKKEIINWGKFNKGVHAFKVILTFSVDNDNYILSREYALKSPNLNPDDNKNYRDNLGINKNGMILSATECEHVINSIMPEQVSRFFLFDGELLQEYEELLHEEKGIGQKIKNAIEEILGVPVLTNSCTDMNVLATSYMDDLTEAAQKDVEYKAQADALSRATSEINSLKENLQAILSEQAKLNAEIAHLEAEQSKNGKINDLINEITKQREAIASSKEHAEECKQKICDYSGDLWRVALSETLIATRSKFESRRTELKEKQNQHIVAEQLLEELQKSCDCGHCVICDSTVTPEIHKKLRKRIEEYSTSYSALDSEEEKEYDDLKQSISLISKMLTQDVTEAIKVLEEQIADSQVDIADAESKIKDLEKDIDDYSRQKREMEDVARDLSKKRSLLAANKAAEEDIKNQINEKNADIQKATQKLASKTTSQADISEAHRKHKFCSDLYSLFNKGLDRYRQYLKDQVQEDATTIFLSLSNNKEYSRLEINDNYGLNIIHDSGKLISIRSAGFEHIVALSLIGALHKNAPLQGPIIMDSPFGRLDSEHEDNIIKYLPQLANQVMLFVFDKEIDEQKARKNLGSYLIKELILERGANTFETVIKPH